MVCFHPIIMLNICATCISWEIGSWNTQKFLHMNIRTFVAILSRNPQYDFPKMRGGRGSKAVWNFSENSSVLVGPSVPKSTWILYFDHLSTFPGLSLLTKAFHALFIPVLLQVEILTDTILTDLKTLTQGSPPGWLSSTEARCPAWGSRMTSSQRCTNFYIGGKFIWTFETRVKL